jgi:hypothetical protein
MKIFITALTALILVTTCVYSQEKVTFKNSDLVSVVITVKTAKEMLASLTTKTLPKDATIHAMKASLTRTLYGPFPIAEPIPNVIK